MPEDIEIDPALLESLGTEEVEPEAFTLPDDFATQVQSWGVPIEAIPEAVERYKSLQTEDGVIDAFIATGQSLGFGLKDLNRLFQDEVVAPPTPAATPAHVEAPDPEALMTRAEVDAMLTQVRTEQQSYVQQQEQARLEAAQAEVHRGIEGWFDGQEVTDQHTRTSIANFAQKHVLANQNPYDMRVIASALERGKAEYDAWVEAEAQNYLRKKVAKAGGQPTSLGGAPSGTIGNEDAPADYVAAGGKAMDLARQRVRDRLRAAGELG